MKRWSARKDIGQNTEADIYLERSKLRHLRFLLMRCRRQFASLDCFFCFFFLQHKYISVHFHVRVCVCVCVRDSFELFFISRGAMNTLEGIAQRRPFHRVVIFLRDASGTYLQQFLKFAAVTHGTPSLRPDRRSRPCALGLLSF